MTGKEKLKRTDKQVRLIPDAYYHALFENAPYPTYVIDADLKIRDINKAGLLYYHLDKSDTLNMTCGDGLQCINSSENPGCGFSNPCQQCNLRNAIKEALTGGKAVRSRPVELFSRIDEEPRHLLVSVSPCKTAEGNMVIVTQVDVTEQIRARGELEKSEAKYRNIVENINESLIIHHLDGTVIDVNSSACQVLGYSREELVGSNLSMINSPVEERAALDRIKTLQKEGSIIFEGSVIAKDGSEIPVEVSSRLISDEDRCVIQSIGRDIGERIRAEETRRRFRTALDSNQDSIFIIDRENMLFIDANATASSHLGYSVSELKAMGPQDIKPDYSKTLLAEIFDSIICDPERHKTIKTMHQRKDGSLIPVEINLRAFKSGGKDFLIASARDISERIKFETELKAEKARAERANRAKSDFLINMSHEIRTPMNVVVGISRLLSESGLNSKQKELSDMVIESSQSLLNIINDILDISKVEAGQMEICPEWFSIIDLVEKLEKVYSHQAEEKGLALHSCIEPGVPRFIRGDQKRIRQILVNLIGNALKFTPEGSITIDLSLRNGDNLANTEQCTGAYGALNISISDTGSGISDGKLKSIFESFVQGDNSLSRNHEGTGLGLSISRQLAQLMGGKLSVESRVGVGSRFTFSLPLSEDEQNRIHDTGAEACTVDKIAGLSALIVDDNKASRMIIENTLESWSMKVTSVSSANKCLELLQNRAGIEKDAYDLIIVDQQMPDMDGFKLCSAIRNLDNHDNTPLIMLSSLEVSSSRECYREAGLDSYLLKPVDSSSLFNCISSLFSSGSPGKDSPEDAGLLSGIGNRLAGCRVLLVEDKPMNQKLATMMLAKKGCLVTAAANGAEAISILDRSNFDLILMDIQMPVMDGIEACKAIRSSDCPDKKNIPVIALTAHAMQGDRDRCIAAGMNSYVTKPIDPEELFQAMEKTLGHC